MPLPYPYPYDSTGTASSNLIVNELHAVQPPSDPLQANFIVPRAAPFFTQGAIVRTGVNVSDPVLVEGTDFVFTHYFDEATQSLLKPVFGSIKFLDKTYTGNVYLTYQTLGGAYTLDDYSIVEQLTRSEYNINTVWWSQITGLPVAFPPAPHPHDVADMTGMADVVVKLDQILQALQAVGVNLPSLATALTQHLSSPAAHDKTAVGLGLVQNFGVALLADVQALASNKYMTPEMTKKAIDLYAAGGGSSVPEATTTIRGIVRRATQQEGLTGANVNAYIVPTVLAAVLAQALTPYSTTTQMNTAIASALSGATSGYIPNPPAAGKKLVSTGNTAGAWNWADDLVIPTPSEVNQILTATGTTPGSFSWQRVQSMSNRALEAAYLHDGFQLVWKSNTLYLMPKNGGLIWVNGNLYQIPTNGISYAPMLNNSTWVSTVNTNHWIGKSFWVVVKENGSGGLVLDLTGDIWTFGAGGNGGNPYDLYELSNQAPTQFVLHPTTQTPSMFLVGSGNGYQYQLTTVGAIKLAYHGGYYPGYTSNNATAKYPNGNFVHSLDSSGKIEATLTMYRYGKWYGPSGYTDMVFKQDTPTASKRYVPDPALNSQIPDVTGQFTRSYDGSTISSLLGCASAYAGDFQVDYHFSLQMTSASGNERLWAGVADGDNYIFTHETLPDNPGDWPNPPSYIVNNGINLPRGFPWTPIINAWNVGGSAHGHCRLNADPQPNCTQANIFLFADNANFGAPTSSIKLMQVNIRMWRDNQIWRRDV